MFILFIVVSFHHQSKVIFSITINGKQIFDCKVTTDFRLQSYISFTKKADTILLILSIILILVIFFNKPRQILKIY